MKKVLMVYADAFNDGILPIGLATLIAVLKPHFEVKLFDTTFYPGKFNEMRKWREKSLEYKKLEGELYEYNKTDVVEDFYKVVSDFKPDIIGVSATSSDYQLGLDLIKDIKNIPIIFGGVHATIAPEDIIVHPNVDYVFRGEAEEVIVDLFKDIIEGNDLSKYSGLWYKNKDSIMGVVKKGTTGCNVVTDLDKVPPPDWSLFDERHFRRPFMGKVYKMGTYENARGCPYATCSYCVMHTFKKLQPKNAHYREKSVDKTIKEIKNLIKSYDISLIKFWDENFLGHKKKTREFLKRYKEEIGIPFMIQTRPENVTEEFAKLLKESNCVNLSVGIEHGNEEIRKNILKRYSKNENIIKGFDNCNKYGLRTTSFLIMGVPTETRENIFEGIKLIKRCNPSAVDTFFLFPYKGSEIHKYCVEHGLLSPDEPKIYGDTHYDYIINHPKLSLMELRGLRRTFSMYVKTDENYWDIVKEAEQNDHLYEYLNSLYAKVIHGN